MANDAVMPADPGPNGSPAGTRASDSEREAVVERLTAACAEGRLTLEELGWRVETAYSAVQQGDLVPLVADLPEARAVDFASRPLPAEPGAGKRRRKRRFIVGVMGENSRSGHWRLPSDVGVVTVMGETTLDLRQATIEAPEVAITLFLLMGEQVVVVPECVDVEVTGAVVMGQRRVKVSPVAPRAGVPRLHVRVRGLMGEVRVETAPPVAPRGLQDAASRAGGAALGPRGVSERPPVQR